MLIKIAKIKHGNYILDQLATDQWNYVHLLTFSFPKKIKRSKHNNYNGHKLAIIIRKWYGSWIYNETENFC